MLHGIILPSAGLLSKQNIIHNPLAEDIYCWTQRQAPEPEHSPFGRIPLLRGAVLCCDLLL
jgi:hypothetical protein